MAFCLDMSSSPDSSHSKVHENLLLLNDILSVPISARSQRCDFGCCSSLMDPMAQSFDFTQPIPVRSHALLHCVFAVFISVLFPQTGRRSFPNHREDDFGDEWSCVNCKKHTRVSSTAISVFSKAFFCCSGIIAALALALVNFLVQLLKVFSLLVH